MKAEGGRMKAWLLQDEWLKLSIFSFIVAAFTLHPCFSCGSGDANL
jgi:hypothetical protein